MTQLVPEALDTTRTAEPTVEAAQPQRTDEMWQEFLDELKVHVATKQSERPSEQAAARVREAAATKAAEEKTQVEKEADEVSRTLDVIAEKQKSPLLAQHTRLDWIDQQRAYLTTLERNLQQYAQRMGDTMQGKEADTAVKRIQKGLADLTNVERMALEAAQESVTPKSETTRLSQQALDQLSRALIHGTTEKDSAKGFEDLRQAEKLEIGQKMYQMAKFIKSRADYETSFTDQERQNIENLEQEGMRIIGEERARQLEQERFKQVTTPDGVKMVDSWEDDMLSFLADPDGKIQQTFGRNTPGYARYKRDVLAALRDSDILQKMLHKFAHNLGSAEAGRGMEAILERGLSSKREEVQIRALEERAQAEMRERLGISNEVREYLVETYGEEADPAKFIETARKTLDARRAALEKDTSLTPQQREQQLLLEAAKLVGSFASPTGEASLSQYTVSDLLNNPDEEITCSIRALILKQVITEVFGDQYVVLAENQDATFDKETGTVLAQNHARLFVLDTTRDGRGFFVDPLHGASSGYLLEEVSGLDLENIKDAYAAFKHNPQAAELAIKTKLGTIGVADRILMADNMNNLATFLIQEGDTETARSLAEAALAYNPTTTGYLLLALLAEGEIKQEYLEAALEASPELEWLRENFPEQFETYTTNLAELRVQRTWQEFQQDMENLKASRASRADWMRFIRDVYAQINRWQKNKTYSSDFNMGVSYITGILYTAMDEFYNYLPPGETVTPEDRAVYKQYDALVRLGDVDVAISRSDYQTANTTFEKFDWDSQYGSYRDIPGVAIALRSMDRQAFRSLTDDKGIYTWQQAGENSPFYQAAYRALDGDRSWYTDRTQNYEDARKLAADLAFRLYCTDFTWSVRMTFGRRLQGDQKYAGQKRGALAALFDPIFSKDHTFTDVEKAMVDMIGEANVRAATRGFNDGPGMLTHRRLMLNAIVNYSMLTHQSLHRQFRDAKTMEGYHGQLSDIEEEIAKVERSRHVGKRKPYEVTEHEIGSGGTVPIVGGILGSIDVARQKMMDYFTQQGYSMEQLQDDQFYLDRLKEEKAYLDMQVMHFDKYSGQERATYAPEVLANMLIYGEALAAVDGHFSVSDTLYDLLEGVGERAVPLRGSREIPIKEGASALEVGKMVNDHAHDLNQFGYERNLRYEKISSDAARAVVNAIEAIQDKLSRGESVQTIIDDIRNLPARRLAANTAKANLVAFNSSSPYKIALDRAQKTFDIAKRQLDAATLSEVRHAKTNYDRAVSVYQGREEQYKNELKRLNEVYATASKAVSEMEARPGGKLVIAVEKMSTCVQALTDRNTIAVAAHAAAENFSRGGVTVAQAARDATITALITKYPTGYYGIAQADLLNQGFNSISQSDLEKKVAQLRAAALSVSVDKLTPPQIKENEALAEFTWAAIRRTSATAAGVDTLNENHASAAEKAAYITQLKEFINTTSRDRDTAVTAYNNVARLLATAPTILNDKARRNGVLQTVLTSAKVSVIDRLRYDQILTLDNLIEMRGIFSKTAARGITARDGFAIGTVTVEYRAIRDLYDKKAELIANRGNWADIRSRMRDSDGRTRSLTTVSGGTISHFNFKGVSKGEKRDVWAQILDEKAVIAHRVNKSRGDGYIMSYTDDVREVVVNDREMAKLASNKPAKGRFGDAGAAQEDVKALLKRLAEPQNERVWIEGNGHNADYNSREVEQYRNSRWLDAAVEIQASSRFARLYVSPTMSGILELLLPDVFASKLRKINHEHGISKNNEQLRNWLNAVALSEVVSGKYLERIRKKRKLNVSDSIIPWIMQFLELLGISFATNVGSVTGFNGK